MNRVCQGLACLLGIWAVAAAIAAEDGADMTRIRVVDRSGEAVVGAVVWHAMPDGVGQVEQHAVIDQIDKRFVPRITVITAGTEVLFPNSDSVSHHVYSFSRPNAFELPLYRSGEEPVVRFNDPGIVTLGCNIHDAMLGYIVIVDARAFAVTDADGYAELPVPSVDTPLSIWSERLDPQRRLVARLAEPGTWLIDKRQKRERGSRNESLAWEDY